MGSFWVTLYSVAFATSSFTSLRMPGLPLGVSELMLLAALVGTLIQGVKAQHDLKKFNIALLVIILILTAGYLYSAMLGLDEKGGASHDYFAFILVVLTVFCFQSAVADDKLKTFFLVVTKWSLLSVIALAVLSVFFYPSGARFSGLSKNPNQLALFCILVMIFASLYLSSHSLSWSKSPLFISTMIGACYVGWRTGSDAFYLASIASVLCWCVGSLLLNKSKYVSCFGWLLLLAVLTLLMTFNEYYLFAVYEYFDDMSSADDQGSVRFNLWYNGVLPLIDSPLIGFGPGAWSGLDYPLQGHEAHNTFIDFANSSGVFGVIVFLYLVVTVLFRMLKAQMHLTVALFLALLFFCLFHYILRNPFVWVVLLTLYWFPVKMQLTSR